MLAHIARYFGEADGSKWESMEDLNSGLFGDQSSKPFVSIPLKSFSASIMKSVRSLMAAPSAALSNLIGVKQILASWDMKDVDILDVCYSQHKVKIGRKFARDVTKDSYTIAMRFH
jgi:hypothetical protein